MRTAHKYILACGLIAGLPTLSLAQNGAEPPESGLTGAIRLETANRACGALTPDGSGTLNPNPDDLNDNDLDDAEIAAIEEGCTLRATAIAPNGLRLSGVPLVLVRSAAPDGDFLPFGYPRTTNAQGQAAWRFQPTANTDFIYVATSPGQTGQSVRSNEVEIQLCTGDDSVGVVEGAPQQDAGLGCENNDNEGDDDNIFTEDDRISGEQ